MLSVSVMRGQVHSEHTSACVSIRQHTSAYVCCLCLSCAGRYAYICVLIRGIEAAVGGGVERKGKACVLSVSVMRGQVHS